MGTSKLASLRDQVQLVADTASEQRKQIKADLQFQAEMRERENRTALTSKTDVLSTEVAELRATLHGVEKSVIERTSNAVTRIMQEVDQKMSITSDMVKSNVLEMRRHKESVSTQLNGYESELGGIIRAAAVSSRSVDTAKGEIVDSLELARKKIRELEAVAYRGSSNTSLVSRLRDDVESLQSKLTKIKNGGKDTLPDQGVWNCHNSLIHLDERRMLKQWGSIHRVQTLATSAAAPPGAVEEQPQSPSKNTEECAELKQLLDELQGQADALQQQATASQPAAAAGAAADFTQVDALIGSAASERSELQSSAAGATEQREVLYSDLEEIQAEITKLTGLLGSAAPSSPPGDITRRLQEEMDKATAGTEAAADNAAEAERLQKIADEAAEKAAKEKADAAQKHADAAEAKAAKEKVEADAAEKKCNQAAVKERKEQAEADAAAVEAEAAKVAADEAAAAGNAEEAKRLQEIADAAAFNAAREKAEADEAERHAEAAAFNAAREQAEAEKARKESAEKAAKEKAEAAAAAAASADAIEAARAEAEAEAEALKSPVPAPATAADGEPQPRGSPEWCKWFKDNKGAGPEPDMNKEMDKWVQWLTDNEQVDREVKKAKREFEESGGAVGACPGVDLAENKGSLYVCGGI